MTALNLPLLPTPCPSECDWPDYALPGEPCPQHGDGAEITEISESILPQVSCDSCEPEAEPVVVVFSKFGIENAKPDSPDCPTSRLISIGHDESVLGDAPPKLQAGWTEVLRLTMDDTTDPKSGMTPAQAEQVLDFLDKDPVADFAVHCAAGVSRSVGVAAFAHRAYGHRLRLRGGSAHEGTGNPLVYRRLVAAYVQRCGVDALDDLAPSGLPFLLDTPILRTRAIYAPSGPASSGFRFGPMPPVTPLPKPAPERIGRVQRAWIAVETRLPKRPRLLSVKLRLRLKWGLRDGLKPYRYDLDQIGEGLRNLGAGLFGVVSVAAGALSDRLDGKRGN